jgi:hypothetical protein
MNGSKRLLIILGAYVLNVAFVIGSLALLQLINGSTVKIFWSFPLVTSAIIVGTQALFVLPLVRPPSTTLYGKSLFLSMIIAALIASINTFALVVFIFSIVTTMFLDFPDKDQISEWFILGFLGCSWILWSILLIIFAKRRNKDASPLVKLTSWLFAGSLVEFLLSIPLVIMVNRRSSCYCETGSFLALVASFVAAFWLFGPFMLILLFWRKRPWQKDHCLSCGYPRKVTGANVCSECGSVY